MSPPHSVCQLSSFARPFEPPIPSRSEHGFQPPRTESGAVLVMDLVRRGLKGSRVYFPTSVIQLLS